MLEPIAQRGSARGIRLRKVEVAFSGAAAVVKDIDLEIPAGRFVSLVGASGSGKSTLLRVMAGLIQPTQGEVRPLQGSSDGEFTESPIVEKQRGEVGFVFQHPTLLPWRTALDNVLLPLDLGGSPRAQAEPLAREACALVKLTPADQEKLPRMLSGGMQMRVSIARAIVTRPAIMLLDEPFAAIDDLLRHRLNDDLAQLWGTQGWTAVFVTHHLPEAVFMSERVHVLRGSPGRIVATIDVPLPFPRPDGIRGAPEFQRLVAQIEQALREGIS